MKELIERLEQARGPNPELGRDVLLACGWRKTNTGYFLGQLFHWSSPDRKTTFDDDDFYRHDPTASIDAALTLVPEGWRADLYEYDDDQWHAGLRIPGLEVGTEDRARTLALALCIASLKARMALDAK